MDASINLPPELQEIEDELQEASKKGDLEACRALVARLATEAEFGGIIIDGIDSAILKIEEDKDTFPEISSQANSQINELKQTRIAGIMAGVRHNYATLRLHAIENAAQDYS